MNRQNTNCIIVQKLHNSAVRKCFRATVQSAEITALISDTSHEHETINVRLTPPPLAKLTTY